MKQFVMFFVTISKKWPATTQTDVMKLNWWSPLTGQETMFPGLLRDSSSITFIHPGRN